MTFFPGNDASDPHKYPITHNRRPGLTRRDLFHSTPSNDSENDSDRVSKLSRRVRNYGPLTQKAIEAVSGQHQGKAPRKPLQKHGPLIIPFAKPAAIKYAPTMTLVAVLGLPQQHLTNHSKTFQTTWMQSLHL
ncbi:hypothetical protein COCHEDRAFT_1195134 [Bipolaris maydis C5]|uniref:Uncharacterized protein n=1 Tax=Cochliobolus heterostrophus (strain C5 / ATCC 48332 / race O) TaxID=701091 RepID=M2TTI4_COCH5|nr:hypothetical protein COCHEDRAFT_1195134 [Bipolaris maydis C5]